MKVLYLLAQNLDWVADLSGDSYGGDVILPRTLSKFLDFHVYAETDVFRNCPSSPNHFKLPKQTILDLLRGSPIKEAIPASVDYDVLFHCHEQTVFNTEGTKLKQAVWVTGTDQEVNLGHSHVLLFDRKHQKVKVPMAAKIYDFVLGIPVPPEPPAQTRGDYIFQCSRHLEIFNSVEIAKICLKNKIPLILAGPVAAGYPLWDYIDGQTVKYLGMIPQSEMLQHCNYARLVTAIHNWGSNGSQFVLLGQSRGAPVVSTYANFWIDYVKVGYNGFYAHNEEELLGAYDSADKISPVNCWRSTFPYSNFLMIESVFKALEEIAGS